MSSFPEHMNGEGNGESLPEPPAHLQSDEAQTLYRFFHAFGSTVLRRFDAIDRKLDKALEGRSVPPPSARPEAKSSVALLEDVKREASVKVRELAAQTPGPEVDPKKVETLVEELVAGALLERDNAANRKTVEQWRKLRWGMVVAFLLAFAGAWGTWSFGKGQGALEERAKAAAPAR